MFVETVPWTQWSECTSKWDMIHSQCPDASYFLSREWVTSWLATFGESLQPDILSFHIADRVVGYCLLVRRTKWIKGIPLRRIYFNCAGENPEDSTCIEYNSILAIPEFQLDVVKALVGCLRKRKWDELYLQGFSSASPLLGLIGLLGEPEVTVRPSHYVDLRATRNEDGVYDSRLSSNIRGQVRRSRRLYEKAAGECTLHRASTTEDALKTFDRLIALHQSAWQDRGKPGVFASELFTQFHRRMIRTQFEHDRIMLIEVHAGSEPIGVLYSFLFRGTFLFYQSGFRYTTDGRIKPGLLTHYMAINACLADSNVDEYDFLAGDAQYKRSLSTDRRCLHWVVVRRRNLAGLLFRGLRWVKRRYVGTSKKSDGSIQQAGRSRCAEDPPISGSKSGPLAIRA